MHINPTRLWWQTRSFLGQGQKLKQVEQERLNPQARDLMNETLRVWMEGNEGE